MKALGRLLLVFVMPLFATLARAQQWDWIQQFSSDTAIASIAVDADNNVYVAGNFTGTNSIGTNRFVSAGGVDIFVLKLNAYGELLWAISSGGPLNDSIADAKVTSDGALFIVGRFAVAPELIGPDAFGSASNAIIARVDDGKFTWFDSGGVATALTVAPDGSLWVAGYDDMVFTANYSRHGQMIERRTFNPEALPRSWRAVPDHNGNAYVCGTFANSIIIGTNEIRPSYYVAQITAALGSEGVRWYWSASLGYSSYATGIAVAPDGSIISMGYIESKLPNRYAFIAKHAPDGRLLWLRNKGGGCTKHFWTPTAVSFDAAGNILVACGANLCPIGPCERAEVRLLTLNPVDGDVVLEYDLATEERSVASAPPLAISGDSSGAIFLGGKPPHGLQLGSNGLYAVSHFVARRSTLKPTLTSTQVGTNIVFSWPHAAYPVALQQSDATGSNWVNVPNIPDAVAWQRRVTIPAESATGYFRLVRTNEAVIGYAPVWSYFTGPSSSFLEHRSVIFGGSTARFAVTCTDRNGDRLAFSWLDATNAVSLPGTATSNHVGAYCDPNGYRHLSTDQSTFDLDTATLAPGIHTLQVIASDGMFSITNFWTIEIITLDTAYAQFLSALDALRGERAGRQAVALWEGWLRAADKERSKLAEKRWRHFQRQLARVTSLTDDQRAQLASAAELLKPLL